MSAQLLNHLSAGWLALVEQSGLSDRMIFAIGTTLTVMTMFWPLNIALYYCYKWKLFQSFLIQPGLQPDPQLVRTNVLENLASHVVVVPILSYFLFDLFALCSMPVREPLPSVWIILRDLAVSVLLADTLGYWFHRLIHHPWLYKWVHKKHHIYKVNVGVASTYATPMEDVLSETSLLAGSLLMGSHILVVWLWIWVRVCEAVMAHSGYQFFPPSWTAPFTGGAYHEFHHTHNIGNFGQFFTFWDHVMGTDAAYIKYLREKQGAKQGSDGSLSSKKGQ